MKPIAIILVVWVLCGLLFGCGGGTVEEEEHSEITPQQTAMGSFIPDPAKR